LTLYFLLADNLLILNYSSLDRPDPPIGIRAFCTNNKTAEIIWISKFNGGSSQQFRVGVKRTNDSIFEKGDQIKDPGENEIVTGIVNELLDGTRYLFTVFAESKYGQSTLATDLVCKTPTKGNVYFKLKIS